MLRFLGIPARVAVGFTAGTWKGGVWTVTDHQAHAWVEAWFAGYGWLAFDPTPGRGTLSAVYTLASDSADAVAALGTGRFLDFTPRPPGGGAAAPETPAVAAARGRFPWWLGRSRWLRSSSGPGDRRGEVGASEQAAPPHRPARARAWGPRGARRGARWTAAPPSIRTRRLSDLRTRDAARARDPRRRADRRAGRGALRAARSCAPGRRRGAKSSSVAHSPPPGAANARPCGCVRRSRCARSARLDAVGTMSA